MLRIVPRTQNYDWGKLGNESKVSELASATPGISLDPSKPYAELWMGTHPNGPNTLLDGTPLKQVLNETNLSPGIFKVYKGDLPFLFKVLSIRKALSIQAHPDKKLAAKLFAERPDLYKDSNHKPEMAVALTPFQAFIGFRPLEEIDQFLTNYPEFATVVGADVSKSFHDQVSAAGSQTDQASIAKNKKVLKDVFSAIQRQDADLIKTSLENLITRIDQSDSPFDKLLKSLAQQYPADVGIYCAFLLNYVILEPGQGIFLAANEPHAYLFGDCVECMAASDNVVRSGLTPKFKDVDTLLNMLTYNYGPADSQIMNGAPVTPQSKLYDPPIEEFSILETTCKSVAQIQGVKGPSIMIVTLGSGKANCAGTEHELVKGSVWFIGADCPIDVTGDFTAYQAFCEL